MTGVFRLPEASAVALPLPAPHGSWAVYLILCRNGALYCGITNRPAARWQAHLHGRGARYTRMHPPLAMRIVCPAAPKAVAARGEYRIKRLAPQEKKQLWAALGKDDFSAETQNSRVSGSLKT